MKLNYVIEFVADRSRSWVHSIPDLSLLLPELNRRNLRAKVQVGKPPAPADPPLDGRKPTLTGLGAVTPVSTIIYGPCRSRLAWRTLVAKVKDGVLLPARYAQPNHEGTADPLARVLAKSRLMSAVQEFRNEKNETGSRIS